MTGTAAVRWYSAVREDVAARLIRPPRARHPRDVVPASKSAQALDYSLGLSRYEITAATTNTSRTSAAMTTKDSPSTGRLAIRFVKPGYWSSARSDTAFRGFPLRVERDTVASSTAR